jgi:hypothetical protein
MRLEIGDDAEKEIAAANEYYDNKSSAVGDQFVAAIEHGFQRGT